MWSVTPFPLHDMEQALSSTVGMVMLSLKIYIFKLNYSGSDTANESK